LGLSTGGVIARYGLREMEIANQNHDTRLLMSIDAPHRGAYMPINLQLALVQLEALDKNGVNMPILHVTGPAAWVDFHEFDEGVTLAIHVDIFNMLVSEWVFYKSIFSVSSVEELGNIKIDMYKSAVFPGQYMAMVYITPINDDKNKFTYVAHGQLSHNDKGNRYVNFTMVHPSSNTYYKMDIYFILFSTVVHFGKASQSNPHIVSVTSILATRLGVSAKLSSDKSRPRVFMISKNLVSMISILSEREILFSIVGVSTPILIRCS
jgi:hypothetical protein